MSEEKEQPEVVSSSRSSLGDQIMVARLFALLCYAVEHDDKHRLDGRTRMGSDSRVCAGDSHL